MRNSIKKLCKDLFAQVNADIDRYLDISVLNPKVKDGEPCLVMAKRYGCFHGDYEMNIKIDMEVKKHGHA